MFIRWDVPDGVLKATKRNDIKLNLRGFKEFPVGNDYLVEKLLTKIFYHNPNYFERIYWLKCNLKKLIQGLPKGLQLTFYLDKMGKKKEESLKSKAYKHIY